MISFKEYNNFFHKQEKSLLTIVRSLETRVNEYNSFFSQVFEKSKFKIDDKVFLKRSLGPFPTGHGWRELEPILVEDNEGKIQDVYIDENKSQLSIVSFCYLVSFPFHYYNGSYHRNEYIGERNENDYHVSGEKAFLLGEDVLRKTT